MKRPFAQGQRVPGVGAGLAGTITVHMGAIGIIWLAVRPPAPSPPVYAVELVAAPAPAPAEKPAPETVARPPAEETAPVKPPKNDPKPAPKPPTPKPADKPAEPNPRTSAKEAPLPGEKPSTGSDAVTVSTPGLAFPFPEYLKNIVQEVYRRWDRPMGNSVLRAEVSFLILRDGTVREIKVSRASGNFGFDLNAQGAIEQAGSAKAFGELPDGYEADVLPVSFYFTPRPQ